MKIILRSILVLALLTFSASLLGFSQGTSLQLATRPWPETTGEYCGNSPGLCSPHSQSDEGGQARGLGRCQGTSLRNGMVDALHPGDRSIAEDPGYNSFAAPPQRSRIYELGMELEQQATSLAQESFDHFRGWNGTISDKEQTVLFKSEAFAASCRLFLKLTESQSTFFRADNLRTNVFNAFTFLASSFGELEQEMRGGNVMPYALTNCRKVLTRMEREFSSWPDADNLAYLEQKYVKAGDATVYLIEKRGLGTYIKRPFKNLESVFRYTYDRNRGKNPWKYLVETSDDTLDKMQTEKMIDLTFEGKMIIEQSTRKNRGVYLIQNGKKRPLARPEVVERLGGWGKVFEVPREIIEDYEEGDPIDQQV